MASDITPDLEGTVARKIMWRIIPLSFFLYVVAFLDRVNLGYAALQMNKELALSSEAFGFAAGIFFVGNVLFEVPSNMLVLRFGPRKWIARIIVSWGIVAMFTAFVQNATQLYILRFLLGVAEAGFIPGMVYYFAVWIREKDRAYAGGLFLLAMPVAYLFGAPISTALMTYVNFGGIAGWRWMLFIEGMPAVLGGLLCYLLLTDSPEKASWLTAEEKEWLAGEFERDRALTPHVKHLSTREAIANPTVLFLSLIYFVSQVGALGIGYWLPQIVRNLSATFSLTQIGLMSGLPYAAAGIGMLIWSRLSDRIHERKWCTAIPLAVGAGGLLVAGTTQSPAVGIVAITLALVGMFASKSPFFAMLTQIFSKPTVAVSSAVICAIGNCGGFAGPYLIGLVSRLTGSTSSGVLVLSGALLLGGLMTILLTIPKDKAALASELKQRANAAP